MNLLKYSLLRFALMIVVFLICIYFNTGLAVAAIAAVLIAFAIAYLAFPRLHVAAGKDLARLVKKRKPRTDTVEAQNQAIEDDYVDSQGDILDPYDPKK